MGTEGWAVAPSIWRPPSGGACSPTGTGSAPGSAPLFMSLFWAVYGVGFGRRRKSAVRRPPKRAPRRRWSLAVGCEAGCSTAEGFQYMRRGRRRSGCCGKPAEHSVYNAAQLCRTLFSVCATCGVTSHARGNSALSGPKHGQTETRADRKALKTSPQLEDGYGLAPRHCDL